MDSIDVIGGNGELIVKYKDVFHLKNIYDFCKEWLLENDYTDITNMATMDTTGAEKYFEKFYLEEHEGGVKHIWWWWIAQHRPDGSNFLCYNILTSAHLVAIANTEVMVEGKKYKTNVGEIEFKFYGNLLVDFQSDFWSKSPLLTHFSSIFRKRWYKKNIEDHKKILRTHVYTFQGAVKNYLELKEFLPRSTPFFPQKGLW